VQLGRKKEKKKKEKEKKLESDVALLVPRQRHVIQAIFFKFEKKLKTKN